MEKDWWLHEYVERDVFGRRWPQLPVAERCGTCGQPDNCGDCNHYKLADGEVLELGGKLP